MSSTLIEDYLNVLLAQFRDEYESLALARQSNQPTDDHFQIALKTIRDLRRCFVELCGQGHLVKVYNKGNSVDVVRTVGGINEHSLFIAYSDIRDSAVTVSPCILSNAVKIEVEYKPGFRYVTWSVDYSFNTNAGYARRDEIHTELGHAMPYAYGVGPSSYREPLDSRYWRLFTNLEDAQTLADRLRGYQEVVKASICVTEHIAEYPSSPDTYS